ncbi:uncharacterized protein LOC106669777 [Cimex lectularius]|uniref:Uncharacterized protein n=1 Tax=Cimex lectularius TaxID=79782 RepID=A0A8I6TJC6_CIMLE|nr:uncharacterized protein LOC106669777 [Cimex lectularius]
MSAKIKSEVEDPVVCSLKADHEGKHAVKGDVSTVSFVKVPSQQEDEFDAVGRNVAAKLRGMTKIQQTVAEKLISEILFYGKMDKLTEETEINLEEVDIMSEANSGVEVREAVSL